jgi:hypothetical protein
MLIIDVDNGKGLTEKGKERACRRNTQELQSCKEGS